MLIMLTGYTANDDSGLVVCSNILPSFIFSFKIGADW